jgi:2-iminobutanoate/2-iminopropanoate deaminase
MSKILKINTVKAPKVVGPYSQAVSAGKFIFCSGQIAINPVDNKMITGGIKEQTKQVLENLKAVLVHAGADLNRVVKVEIYLKNMSDFEIVNKVYAEYFKGKVLPSRVTVEVARLPKDSLLEISCMAYKK